MEVSFLAIFYYSGYFITGRLLYFGDDKHTNFSYNIYLQVHCSAVQNTNTHMFKIRSFILNIHTESPPRMDSLSSSYGNWKFSYLKPIKFDPEIPLANRAISDIRPGFELKPQKNQHFPVTIPTAS